MASSNDAMIRKVCNAFPSAFGIDDENEKKSRTTPVKYYLDSVLGSGTSGTVLYARRVRDDAPFAIKVMDVGDYSAQDRMRASGEVCCLLNCNYFSIVKCYEDFVLTERDNPENVLMIALVLDYANAGDLRQEIKNRSRAQRPFAEHEAGLLFIQILLAVHHVHSKRMIHRDIKSANILLCSNGLVKLGDFGFSKHYFQTVSEDVGRTFCGTPYYVAPEIWRRKPYSKKADMFSLGVLLYELLTLKRPFDGPDIDEVMHRTLGGTYEPLPNTISDEMKLIVDALLQAEPKKRPSSKKLLNTPICKLYISVVQEIIQGGPAGGFTPEQEALITAQLKQTKEELQQERKSKNNSSGNSLFFEDIMRHATPLAMDNSMAAANGTAANAGQQASPPVQLSGGGRGYILFGGKLYKQSSDLSWKRRYVCIYGEVNTNKHPEYRRPGDPVETRPAQANGSGKGPSAPSHQEDDFVHLDLLQAVSKETIESQFIPIPFQEIEDAFPVVAKYTGSNAEHAFAVAFKNGKRILFDGKSDQERDEWMRAIQNFLGISDDEY